MEAGLSQVQMARRLRISRSTLNRLEVASQNTTLRTLDQLCRTLKCEPGDLFEPGRLRSPTRRGVTVASTVSQILLVRPAVTPR